MKPGAGRLTPERCRIARAGPHMIDEHAWFYIEGDHLSVVVEREFPEQVSRVVDIPFKRIRRLLQPARGAVTIETLQTVGSALGTAAYIILLSRAWSRAWKRRSPRPRPDTSHAR